MKRDRFILKRFRRASIDGYRRLIRFIQIQA
jgi:hypothetical protein